MTSTFCCRVHNTVFRQDENARRNCNTVLYTVQYSPECNGKQEKCANKDATVIWYLMLNRVGWFDLEIFEIKQIALDSVTVDPKRLF